MRPKGKSQWFLENQKPVRRGVYECATGCGIEFLFWDGSKFGKGITKWRGLTKKEHTIRCLSVSD